MVGHQGGPAHGLTRGSQCRNASSRASQAEGTCLICWKIKEVDTVARGQRGRGDGQERRSERNRARSHSACRPRKDVWIHILRAYSAGRRMNEAAGVEAGKAVRKMAHLDSGRVVKTEGRRWMDGFQMYFEGKVYRNCLWIRYKVEGRWISERLKRCLVFNWTAAWEVVPFADLGKTAESRGVGSSLGVEFRAIPWPERDQDAYHISKWKCQGVS